MKKFVLALFACAISFCCYADTREYVNLGLPSATMWATCNVGASSPWEYGDLFSWGEIAVKKEYTKENYKFNKTNYPDFSKYTSKWGVYLSREDDVAYIKWGEDWSMPSIAQMEELVEECEWQSVTIKGIKCFKVIGKNGNYITLPYNDTTLIPDYWTSQLSKLVHLAKALDLKRSKLIRNCQRYEGLMVRPVRAASFVFAEVSQVQKEAKSFSEVGVRFYNNQEYNMAVKYLQKAAQMTDHTARYYLGLCYYYGRGITQNYSEAVDLFSRELLNKEATYYSDVLYYLGLCYCKGQGVKQDKTQGLKYLSDAAKCGHKEAVEALKKFQ